MAIQEVIKYESDNSVLIYKYPSEDFNTLSKLIVHESQLAVFFSDGQALDTFTPGKYTLETKNIPLISKIRNLVTGGVSPFHCEVYFINTAMAMNIIWGTPGHATVRDPNYGYSYNVGASGSMALKVIDGRNLLINLVGTEDKLTVTQVKKYFKDLVVTRVINYISVELSKYSYNTINSYLNDISTNIQTQLKVDLNTYGIDISNFLVSAINIDPSDLSQLKSLDNLMALKRFEAMGNRDATIIEAQGFDQARKIQGYTWQEEQQFDVSKTFAQNEGFASNPANMFAQIPAAFAMGQMINDNISNVSPAGSQQTYTLQTSHTESSSICKSCKHPLVPNAKFCSFCGAPIETKHYCSQCGAVIDPQAKFCSECGGSCS